MPWTHSFSRKRRPRTRLRRGLRRWRYDHSEHLRSFWIGAAVVTTALVVVAAARLIG